jgi:hypothetical protein
MKLLASVFKKKAKWEHAWLQQGSLLQAWGLEKRNLTLAGLLPYWLPLMLPSSEAPLFLFGRLASQPNRLKNSLAKEISQIPSPSP